MGQIKRNSINICGFFEVHNFCYGHPSWLFVPDSKNLATPLTEQYSWLICYFSLISLGSVECGLHENAVWQLISHSSVYTEELLVVQLVKTSLNFVKVKCSLPCSQRPTLEPHASTYTSPSYFFVGSNVSLSSKILAITTYLLPDIQIFAFCLRSILHFTFSVIYTATNHYSAYHD